MSIADKIQQLTELIEKDDKAAHTKMQEFFGSLERWQHKKKELYKLPPESFLLLIKLLNSTYFSCDDEQMSKILLDVLYLLIEAYNKINKDSICNDMSLLFINMEAFHLLKLYSYPLCSDKPIEDIETSLEQVLDYNDNGDVKCDQLLLGLLINNLTCILIKRQQYEKAFKLCSKMTEKLETHFKKLKIDNDKKIKEKIIILVNNYYLAASALKGHIEQCRSELDERSLKEYNEILDEYSERGMEIAIDYLGKKSIMSKLLKKVGANPKQIAERVPHVPPLKKNPKQEEQKLIKKLEQVVNTCIETKFETIQAMLVGKTEDKEPPGSALICQSIFKYDKNTQILGKLYQDRHNRFSFLKLSLQKNGLTVHRLKVEENMLTPLCKDPLTLMAVPFSVQYETCRPYQFLEYYVMPHIRIQPDNKILFNDLPTGLLREITLIFLDEQSKIILTHIKSHIFRICITSQQSGVMYIIMEVGSFKDQFNYIVEADYEQKKIDQSQEIIKMKLFIDGKYEETAKKEKKFIPRKSLTDTLTFQKLVLEAISKVQIFIKQQFLQNLPKEKLYNSEVVLFKYHLHRYQEQEASLHAIVFNEQLGFQITVQNLFETVSPNGTILASGHCLYNFWQLQQDFGVDYFQIKFKIEKLEWYELILKLFTLRVYKKELTLLETSGFRINAIKKKQIIKRIYRRSFLKKNYYVPITACLLAIDGQEPIGLKITHYNIEGIYEKGVFLTIDCEKWKKKKKPAITSKLPPEKLKKLDRFKYKTEYEMVSDYYLMEILTKGGLQLLLDLFQQDPQHLNSYFIRADKSDEKWERLQILLTVQRFQKKLEQLDQSYQ